MKRLICTFVAIALLATTPVIATTTGNSLKEAADLGEQYPKSYPGGYFDGYVGGIVEGTTIKICFPADGATNEQVWKVVKKFLKDHPEKVHWPAPDLVLMAISHAWPCKK